MRICEKIDCYNGTALQGWGQVKYLYLVLDAKSGVLGTYLYLTLWNSKVLGTYLYLKAKYLILVQVLSSTFVKLTCIFRLKFEYVFFNKSPLNTIMINYWNGSNCVLTAWGLQTSRLDCLPWSAGQKYLKSLAIGRWGCNLKVLILKFISRIDILSISCDTLLPSVEDHKTSLIISEHWFKYWLGAIRKWAITRASVDPDMCCHLALHH